MESIEAKIVRLILEDLCDRRGLRQEFESCDQDIQDEIRDTWREIVKKELIEEEIETLRRLDRASK